MGKFLKKKIIYSIHEHSKNQQKNNNKFVKKKKTKNTKKNTKFKEFYERRGNN